VAAVLLACVAAAGFGSLAVAVRFGLRRAPEPDLAPLVTSSVAGGVLALIAAAFGQLDLDWDTAWPFAAIGLGVPGLSYLLFVRSVQYAGPSRAAILIGTAPVLSAVIAVALLDEPLHAALAVATVLIVAGGALLAWERERPAGFRALGVLFALTCAIMFAGRDNLVRYAARSEDVPPLGAAAVSLGGACLAMIVYLLVVRRGRSLRQLRTAVPAFLPSAACLAVAYGALVAAYDTGKVTVVAPLNATQSLWAVGLSVVLIRRAEAVGARLVIAALLIVAGSALIGITR
jgi:drug/metabolite transporter (DMT)-like permease